MAWRAVILAVALAVGCASAQGRNVGSDELFDYLGQLAEQEQANMDSYEPRPYAPPQQRPDEVEQYGSSLSSEDVQFLNSLWPYLHARDAEQRMLQEELFTANFVPMDAPENQVERAVEPEVHMEEKDEPAPANLRQQHEEVPAEKRLSNGFGHGFGQSRLSVMMVVFACTGAAIFGVVAAAVFYRRVRGNAHKNMDLEYPAYGVAGPLKPPNSLDLAGDRKLAKSAETYHYQHQKKAMLANEQINDMKMPDSDVDSDIDDVASDCGDYTVYECPGLAPAGCMEVQNPLFIGSDPESTNTISPRSEKAEDQTQHTT